MSCIIRCSVITKREEQEFANLIRESIAYSSFSALLTGRCTGSPEFQEFLEWDRDCEIADNYLISMALIYLLRARYTLQQYTFFNFMIALYLAHEVTITQLIHSSDSLMSTTGRRRRL